MRRVSDMNVSARSRAGDCRAEGQERDSRAAQVSDQRAAFIAVRVYGNVHRVAVIETHSVMRGRLSVRAYGKLAAKLRREKALHLACPSNRPAAPAAVAQYGVICGVAARTPRYCGRCGF